jgi:UDP-N-acetylglucosamine transferase subunit ALG13
MLDHAERTSQSTGHPSRSRWRLQTVTEMPQSDFRRHFQAARLVVAHAGMGTILSALELGTP